MRKGRYVGLAKRTVPVEVAEVLAMFDAKGVIVKQGCGQLLKDLVENLPVGWAEVSAEGLAARKKWLVHNDVREGTQDVRVQFDLSKG